MYNFIPNFDLYISTFFNMLCNLLFVLYEVFRVVSLLDLLLLIAFPVLHNIIFLKNIFIFFSFVPCSFCCISYVLSMYIPVSVFVFSGMIIMLLILH